MNRLPPSQDPPEDVDDQYRRASAQDSSGPSESVRRAVLERAAQLATERPRAPTRAALTPRRPAGRRSWWRPAMVGTLAAAALAGLLITPQFLEPARRPDVSAETPRKKVTLNEEPVPVTPRAAPRAAVAAMPAAVPSMAAGMPAAAMMRGAAHPAGPANPAAALRQAAQIGDLGQLRSLLARPSDINARDEQGRTALMLATVYGQAGAVDVLLAQGADPNAADASGLTPLQAAVAADQPNIAAALGRAGALR
jgi:hypothetical protein